MDEMCRGDDGRGEKERKGGEKTNREEREKMRGLRVHKKWMLREDEPRKEDVGGRGGETCEKKGR